MINYPRHFPQIVLNVGDAFRLEDVDCIWKREETNEEGLAGIHQTRSRSYCGGIKANRYLRGWMLVRRKQVLFRLLLLTAVYTLFALTHRTTTSHLPTMKNSGAKRRERTRGAVFYPRLGTRYVYDRDQLLVYRVLFKFKLHSRHEIDPFMRALPRDIRIFLAFLIKKKFRGWKIWRNIRYIVSYT